MKIPKFTTCREFLKKKQKQKKYQNCLVRMFDRDEYEHMSFRLREEYRNETCFEIYILVLCFWGGWFNGSDDKTSNQYRTTKQNHI